MTEPIDERTGSSSQAPRPGPELFGRGDKTGTPSGEARVDEAMTQLRELAGRPVAEQVAGYEEIHRVLQDTLATVDDA